MVYHKASRCTAGCVPPPPPCQALRLDKAAQMIALLGACVRVPAAHSGCVVGDWRVNALDERDARDEHAENVA